MIEVDEPPCSHCGENLNCFTRYVTPDKKYFCKEHFDEITINGKIESSKIKEKSEGNKHDQEKTRLDLLSASWIEGVGHVLAFGARKYSDNNWRKGIQHTRLLGAALRHTFAYLRGEDLDPETGHSHLLHASCSLMFAYELSQTRPDLDDRYKDKNK